MLETGILHICDNKKNQISNFKQFWPKNILEKIYISLFCFYQGNKGNGIVTALIVHSCTITNKKQIFILIL